MERQAILIMLMIGAVILLIACAVWGEMERLLAFAMRGLLGMAGIHLVNFCLASCGISLGIGINLFTFLTSAMLGIPGFLGLYALGIYQFYV